MIQTPPKNLTSEEYLTYDDGTDNRYELVDGELVMVPLPTADHSDVIDFLSDALRAEIKARSYPRLAKRDVGVYVGVDPETGLDRSRTPDLSIVTQAQWDELKTNKKAAAVLKTPPLLAVEVVSPGSKKTDYSAKKNEYRTIGVLEYWIVDLRKSKVSVLLLVDGDYQTTEFTGNERIISRTFPELVLTAAQVLAA